MSASHAPDICSPRRPSSNQSNHTNGLSLDMTFPSSSLHSEKSEIDFPPPSGIDTTSNSSSGEQPSRSIGNQVNNPGTPSKFYLEDDGDSSGEEGAERQKLTVLKKRSDNGDDNITGNSISMKNNHLNDETMEHVVDNVTIKQDDNKKLLNPLLTYNTSPDIVPSGSASLFTSSNDILNYPTESTNAYSYAHLSPNSLALRLNVLKRSLEILIDRPELITSLNSFSKDALANSGLSPPNTPINNTSALFNPKVRKPSADASGAAKKLDHFHDYEKQHGTSTMKLLNKPFDPSDAHHQLANTLASPTRGESQIKIEANASSAALAAFFRTSASVKHLSAKRSASLQTPFLMNNNRIRSDDIAYLRQVIDTVNEKRNDSKQNVDNKEDPEDQLVYETIRDKLRSTIKLLNDDPTFNQINSMAQPAILPSTSSADDVADEIVLNLHNLSLSNMQDESKEKMLQRKLLYALATPFYESISTNNIVNLNKNISSAALNQFNRPQGTPSVRPSLSRRNYSKPILNDNSILNNRVPLKKFNSFDDSVIKNSETTARPFHILSTSKNITPQAIFTCEIQQPWNLRAANDLSTLIFGLNQSINIKDLKLMDLIASNSKDFVLQKLMKRLGFRSNNKGNHYNKDIIFAGEIVAIKNQQDNEIRWCSLWAKRKNNLLILMFDKIPCCAVDLSVEQLAPSQWKATAIHEVTGKLLTNLGYCDLAAHENLASISKSLVSKLNNKKTSTVEEKIGDVNETRYFTLNLKNRVLPCAVLAEADTSKQDSVTKETVSSCQEKMKTPLVLKIHTLPYIAGIFIISASSYNILSYNRSISKNLFGYGDLINQSINKIIPNFTKLIEFASSTKKLATFLQDIVTKSTPERVKENPGKYLLPGLVLPEHFFRKIQAKFQAHRIIEMRRRRRNNSFSGAAEESEPELFHNKTEEEIEEELFLSSHGIHGKHSDGSRLTIDVQLRVSSIDTLVLWVTYSNDMVGTFQLEKSQEQTSTGKKVKFSTLEDEKESLSRNSSTRTKKLSNGSTSGLNDFEIELSLKASSSSLVSMKYFNTAQTAAIPRSSSLLSDLSDGFNTKTPKRDNYDTGSPTGSNDEFDSSLSTPPTSAAINDIQSIDTTLVKNASLGSVSPVSSANATMASETHPLFKTEEELAEQEQKSLGEWAAKCKNFPTTVGALRRKKTLGEFRVLKELGAGAYGKVLLVCQKNDPTYEIVLKCIYKDRILVDAWVRDRQLGTIPSEIQVMSFLNQFKHPNTLRILDFFEDDECYYVELPIHGNPPAIDLFDFIEIKKSITEDEIRYIFRQIVRSIAHLHDHGLVHRDIKDENVIIDENLHVKLIDYGSSTYIDNGPFSVFVGTMEYAPPEVLHGAPYDGRPQDVWALGVLLYTMVYKENPFYNIDEIMEGELRVPYILSNDCVNLITKILNRNVEKRPTIHDIVDDPWLQI